MSTLPTWETLKQHLASTYGMRPSTQPGFARFACTNDHTTKQVGAFRLRAQSDAEWVALAVKICKTAGLPASTALIANYDLAIGVLCFIDDTLVVRQALPLQTLTVAHLDQTLRALVSIAAERQNSSLAGDHDSPFAYLTW